MKRILLLLALAACSHVEEAEKELGPGAVCTHADDYVYQCVKNGHAYVCIYSPRKEDIECAEGLANIKHEDTTVIYAPSYSQ